MSEQQSTKNPGLLLSFALAAMVILIIAAVTPDILAMKKPDLIKKGEGVTQIVKLSHYFEGIAGSVGDTDVYVLDSGKPGASALVLGGTHPNEPSGILSAVVLIENARPSSGRLFVIPFANASAAAHSDYMEAEPKKFSITTTNGAKRNFRFGSRATSPTEQWPDPDIYVHAASGQKLSGSETRNLNRAYPGRADGTFTEKVAFAITSLIRQEKIDISIDLHEASPEYPVVNAIVAHPRAMPTASIAVLNLEMDGVTIGLEPSPTKLRGLSHREWGDATSTLAILMESANPAQGRLRGKTNTALITEGQDPLYVQAHKLGRLFVPFDEAGWPLNVRVARHVSAIQAVFAAYSEQTPEKSIVLDQVPRYEDLVTKGLGAYLQAP